MAGKFLERDAIIDTVKGEHRINAVRKRYGLFRHPVRTTSCGCPDPNCGAFHSIDYGSMIPTADEAISTLTRSKQRRKMSDRRLHEIALLRAEAVTAALAVRPAFAGCRVSVRANRRGEKVVVLAPRKVDAAGRRELRQLVIELCPPILSVIHYS